MAHRYFYESHSAIPFAGLSVMRRKNNHNAKGEQKIVIKAVFRGPQF